MIQRQTSLASRRPIEGASLMVRGNLKAMTIDERLDRLTGIAESLAASVVEHNHQIEDLFKVAEKHQEES